jgi:hypothetical protein
MISIIVLPTQAKATSIVISPPPSRETLRAPSYPEFVIHRATSAVHVDGDVGHLQHWCEFKFRQILHRRALRSCQNNTAP